MTKKHKCENCGKPAKVEVRLHYAQTTMKLGTDTIIHRRPLGNYIGKAEYFCQECHEKYKDC